MTVTRSFRDTVQTRAAADPDYRYGLLTESMDSMLSGDLETGKALLRDYINATIGFEPLAEAVGKSPKSLMRMFCVLFTSPSPRDRTRSRMPSSA